MNPLIFLLLFPFTLLADNTDTLRIHFISGSKEYKSAESLGKLKTYLEKNHTNNVSITTSMVTDKAKDLPNVKNIKTADVLVVFARRLDLPEEQMKIIRSHWENDKGIVGIRTASHAFSNSDNKVFDLKILGGNYDGHFGDEKVTVQSVTNHPLLSELPPITSSKLYKAQKLGSKSTILQTGTITFDTKQSTQPVTWINSYSEKGRAFYTSLGVPSDFEAQAFLQLIARAIHWSARQNEDR
ncbi:MAG: ThuA domain-containing protein [Akkermansiaceae bacterium]|jgi:type 1 glutamine amidotransferase